MSVYKHIFFDLDHTLWDFYRNSEETLLELYEFYDLGRLSLFSGEDLVKTYMGVNNEMWKNYNLGIIGKEDIRNKRFSLTFDILGMPAENRPEGFNEEYLRICPSKGHLIPYAQDVLTYLQPKYSLHVITNGFSETQIVKMNTSGLSAYFSNVISESCGYLKPHPHIFNHAIQIAGAGCHDCIMIGDDLFADVLGAREAGIDQVFFNRYNIIHEEKVTYEISCLSKLLTIL